MDGKPLYEYARSGTPLPRPIARRPVSVHSLALTHWSPGSQHVYTFPEKKFTDEERKRLAMALVGKGMPDATEIADEPEPALDGSASKEDSGESKSDNDALLAEERPPAFVLSMKVSGGTYVRCIAHDLGHALGSAAHVVTLTRSRQGRFVLGHDAPGATPILTEEKSETEVNVETALASGAMASAVAKDTSEADAKAPEKVDGSDNAKVKEDRADVECIPWEVFARALEHGVGEEPDADGWREWERLVMEKWELIEGKS